MITQLYYWLVGIYLKWQLERTIQKVVKKHGRDKALLIIVADMELRGWRRRYTYDGNITLTKGDSVFTITDHK